MGGWSYKLVGGGRRVLKNGGRMVPQAGGMLRTPSHSDFMMVANCASCPAFLAVK